MERVDGYRDPRLAELYDPLNPWGRGDAYYLELVATARSVLDLCCGTGTLLARAAAEGHPGVLVGVDAAAAMLAVAARKTSRVEWVEDDARTVELGRRFELVVMTGHAFQEFLTDDDVRAVLATARRHLEPGGRLAFETRNPAAREWERWAGARFTVETDGGTAELGFDSVREIAPDLVELSGVNELPGSPPLVDRSTLRFIDADRLRVLLEEAGFRIDGWYGDWDRSPVTPSSPEIAVVASPSKVVSVSPSNDR